MSFTKRVSPIRIGQMFSLLFILLSSPFSQADETKPLAEPPPGLKEFSTSTLIYVSDYFSFVGADSQGRVAFALDNNRGRDGEKYQAEHFVALHDESNGWVEVAGNGRYDNTKKELVRIPDSQSFHFENTPDTGLTITST